MKTCSQCQIPFEVSDTDRAFYDKVSPVFSGIKYAIPEPSLCPECRQQRRLAFRNESKLYKRKCDRCTKAIVSVYPPNTVFPVFCPECWYSDAWSGEDYGHIIDTTMPFFPQFQKLQEKTPRLSLFSLQSNQNSDYTNWSDVVKNSYLLFSSSVCEDCYTSSLLVSCRDCADCLNCRDCEMCAELVDSDRCYHTVYSQQCVNVSDSAFCYDCRGCSYCLLCSNLSNKKFHYKNQPISEEEWRKRWQEHCSTTVKIAQTKHIFQEMVKTKSVHRFAQLLQCEECSGDYLIESQNAVNCYDSKNLQDCKNVVYGVGLRDCSDVYASVDGTQLSYEFLSVNGGYSILFAIANWDVCQNTLYSELLKSCHYCFGCIGLRHKKYCILNKQYTKEEYEILVPKIIEQMRKTGEWGEFFPASISPFGYNETVANEYFPLRRDAALQRLFKWSDYEAPKPEATKVITAEQMHRLPDSIDQIPDDVTNWALTCEVSGKLYKIQKAELAFYRKMKLPIPHRHPDQRHADRMALRNPRYLWKRNCAECNAVIETTYSPDRPEKVLCEACYLKAVV